MKLIIFSVTSQAAVKMGIGLTYYDSHINTYCVTYLGLHSLALPVFGSFQYLTLACKHL